MTGKSGRRRSAVRLVADLERQGARVKQVKNGYRVFYGDAVLTIHGGSSDVNGWRNLRTDVEKAGLAWPRRLSL